MEVPLRQFGPWECGQDGYPFAWHARIKHHIREEAHHRCERCLHPYSKGEGEWSLCDERCRHGTRELRVLSPDGQSEPVSAANASTAVGVVEWLAETGRIPEGSVVQARYRILTVHHLDEDKMNCRWWNLVALCQRCHLRMQRQVVMNRPWHFEHSEWFKPYAAAFYAFKYLGEDLTREETMKRQDELLALEYQGTQGALL